MIDGILPWSIIDSARNAPTVIGQRRADRSDAGAPDESPVVNPQRKPSRHEQRTERPTRPRPAPPISL